MAKKSKLPDELLSPKSLEGRKIFTVLDGSNPNQPKVAISKIDSITKRRGCRRVNLRGVNLEGKLTTFWSIGYLTLISMFARGETILAPKEE